MSKRRLYVYKLIQDGMTVALVESVSKEQAEAEIQHYALIYSQDGPVKIERKKK